MDKVGFRLLSLNTKGLGNSTKRKIIFSWCKNRKADIVSLQESHSQKAEEHLWSEEWGGLVYFSHGQSDARGVCILIKQGLDFKLLERLSDTSTFDFKMPD